MTDAEKRAAIAAARETCARLESLDRLTVRDDHEDTGPNRLDRWRNEVLEGEAKRAAARSRREQEARAETENSMAWQGWVAGQVRDAVCAAAAEIGTEMTARFSAIAAGFDTRDEKISKLQQEVAALRVEIANAEVRRLRALVDADRAAKDVTLSMPTLRGAGGLN